MNDNKEDHIDIRSEEFQEVLGSVPSWILRWGFTLLAVIIVVVLIGSCIFKYPDVITSEMTLTGSNPPSSIISKASGRIKELNVQDNQEVKVGDYLAVIENPACTQDVLILKNYLLSIHCLDSLTELPSKKITLGNMQSIYSSFYTTLSEYQEFNRLQYYSKKTDIIKERINRYNKYVTDLSRQAIIIKEQLDIATGKFKRDSLLHHSGLLSDEELETSKNQYLQGRLSFENIQTDLGNTRLQIIQMKENLLDGENQLIEKKNELENQLKGYISQLLTEIQEWEMNYVLISPTDGEITFTNYWTVNQNITSGENVFNIIPLHAGEFIGKALLPIVRSGKVNVGQNVNIRFNNFPDNEYGIVKGIVRNISLVPVNSKDNTINYIVEISLPQGLKTTYKKDLPYLPEMTAQADIITDNLSLMERLVMPLKKIWTESLQE